MNADDHQKQTFVILFFPLLLLLLLAGTAKGQQKPVLQSIQQSFEQKEIKRSTKILYQLYAGITPGQLPASYQSFTPEKHPPKCATPFVMEFHQHRDEFSAQKVQKIDHVLASRSRPDMRRYDTPSGKFAIFYETSGPNAISNADANANTVPDYVEWTAAAADSSWRHQVQTLGFTDPVAGSTTPYPIFIEDLGDSGFYGFTSTGGNRGYPASTYIVINSQLNQPGFSQNDAQNPTVGAIKVTVAHELKHAIQYANSGWYAGVANSPHSLQWTEMDATFMEEVVYDNVNDYYNYITSGNSIFNDSNHSVPVAYSGASWFLYFAESLGPEFWVDVWTRIRQRYKELQNTTNPRYLTMPEAIKATIDESYDRSFTEAFVQSQLWHLASGLDAGPDFGFEERRHYPSPTMNFNLAGRDSVALQQSIPALSAHFIRVDAPHALPGNVRITTQKTNKYAGLGLLAYFNDGSTGFKLFEANNSGTIAAQTNWRWNEIAHLGIVVTNSSSHFTTNYTLQVGAEIPDKITLKQNYPNPFSESTTIPLTLPENANVRVKLYDTAGRLVDQIIDEQQTAGANPIAYDASHLASGVYVIQVDVDGKVFTKKMTHIK